MHTVRQKKDETVENPDYWRERTLFPGVVPKEVKILIKNINTFDKSFFRKMIKVALGYIQNTTTAEQCEIAFENLCKLCECETEKDVKDFGYTYAGIVSLLQAVLRVNLKTVRQETLQVDLMEMGIPDVHATDICKVKFGPAYTEIIENIHNNGPNLIKLDECDFKVEPVVCNSLSGKIVQPLITMNLKASDGVCHSIEVPTAAFHLLRQSTAVLLRQMEILKRKR